MLNALALYQTTNMDEITRRKFLGFQVPAILNFILLNNLLIYIQSNTKTLWAYLQTFMKTSGLVLVFTNYQRIVIFQISSDQNSAFQIAKFNSSYIRLHGNNCDIPLFLQIDNSLNSLTQSIQSMQTVFECNNTILYTNVMCCSNHLSQ